MRLAKLRGARGFVPLIALVALAAGMAGCEGDDGKTGAQGPAGPPGTGTPGATGPTGPTGPVVGSLKPLESCAICHDDTSVASAKVAHEIDRDITYTIVTPPANVGGNLEFTVNIKVNGANYNDFTTVQRAVVFNGVPAVPPAVGSVYTSYDYRAIGSVVGAPANGNYTLRIAGVGDFAGRDSRYYFRLQSATGVTPARRASVYANDAAYQRVDLVSNGSCQNCHSTFAGDLTSHHYNPFEAKSCIACHSAVNAPGGLGLAYLAHGIHNSHNMPSGAFTIPGEEPFEVTYPTYTPNCSVCHDTPATLNAANGMKVSGPGCYSCHESMESWEDSFAASGLTFHNNFAPTEDCTTCHNASGVASGKVVVTDFHNGIVTERGGIIWGGEDTSVTYGKRFTSWNITGITDNGTNLIIRWAATYDPDGSGPLPAAAVNPCNATVGAAAPVFHAAAGGNLSILRSYFQGDDPILGRDPAAPGQALAVNVTTTNTTCAANVATTTIPVDAGATGRGIVALQGKPRVISVANPAQLMSVRVPTPTREWVVGTGALPTQARRAVADTGACLECHVGSLYQHGGNRVDNVTMCILCHNSASNEQNVRVGMGVDASEAYDGKSGQTYEFKTMLHAIHTAGIDDQKPIVIYRNRGIYAWATDESLLPNWAAGTKCAVASPIPPATTPAASVVLNPTTTPPAGTRFGTPGNIVYGASTNADGTYPTVACQPHTFYSPTYPRAMDDCAACHTSANFKVMVDQTKGMATTLDAGAAPWDSQLDDTLQGANTAACTSCHQGAPAAGHANQNGWIPQVFPAGRQTIIDAAGN